MRRARRRRHANAQNPPQPAPAPPKVPAAEQPNTHTMFVLVSQSSPGHIECWPGDPDGGVPCELACLGSTATRPARAFNDLFSADIWPGSCCPEDLLCLEPLSESTFEVKPSMSPHPRPNLQRRSGMWQTWRWTCSARRAARAALARCPTGPTSREHSVCTAVVWTKAMENLLITIAPSLCLG